jgi:hypothetical protein
LQFSFSRWEHGTAPKYRFLRFYLEISEHTRQAGLKVRALVAI